MKKYFCLMAISLSGFSQTTSTPQMTDRAAARFLEQATWGPTPASIAALEQLGISNWFKVQFEAKMSELPDQPILASNGNSNTNLAPVQAAFFQNAVNGPDQLRQRVAFILSQIWVVSQISVHPAYAFPPYWRIFRNHAFGNYRDIIKAVTLSPAMGTYLNMANNNKGNTAKGTAANENYARELMQLFTLGLTELNPDGSPVLDENKNPVPTYNQAVVTSMAKVVTGWTYPLTPGATEKTNNPAYYFGQLFPVETEHDTTAKAIFNNITIPAGQSAEQDLESLLDALMAQPTMAPFVSEQLIQHMVTSNPSPGYIERVAQVFSSTHGDMKSVIAAILTDTEARAGDSSGAPVNANFGHLREPILFLANMARGLNGTVGASNSLSNYANELGYSDGSGVESYRCDHGRAHHSGKQLASGDIVFTSQQGLARFTYHPEAEEVRIVAPTGEYAGDIAETPYGDWLVVWSDGKSPFQLRWWKPGTDLSRPAAADSLANLLQPALVAERAIPKSASFRLA